MDVKNAFGYELTLHASYPCQESNIINFSMWLWNSTYIFEQPMGKGIVCNGERFNGNIESRNIIFMGVLSLRIWWGRMIYQLQYAFTLT